MGGPQMNFALKLSLKIFLTGVTILAIVMIVVYYTSYKSILTSEIKHAQLIVDEISISIDQNVIEKVKTTKAIAIAPALIKALDESNAHFNSLSAQSRSEEIQSLNNRWKTTKDPKDSFILKYTDNQVSQFLKNLQTNIKGEYGEIFLTNKYGALVASTAKLTTLAHANKYWWKGAYNNGIGDVFFDDRGYDVSVGGYVLGVVVPIKNGDEIIGILKINFNILGALSDLILYAHNERVFKSHKENTGVVKLIRSGGLIVFEEGVEPLSKRIPVELDERLKTGNTSSFIYEKEGEDLIVVMSEIGFTSNIEGFQFGGSFESDDHIQGNRGESWFVVNLLTISSVVDPLSFNLVRLFVLGILLSIAIAIIALIIGSRTAKPLKDLIRQAEQIAKGNFDSRVSINRKDEIGLLATSFNKMALCLNDTTTSIDKLNAEIHERKRVENELIIAKERAEESETKFRTVFKDSNSVQLLIEPETGKIIDTNQAACKFYGYSYAELVSLQIQDINQLSKKEIEQEMQKAKTRNLNYFEFKHKLSNATIKDVEVYSKPISIENETLLISIIHDVTARNLAEQELVTAKAKAEESDRLKSAFLANMSHEIRTPMNGILGFADLLKEPGLAGEEQQTYIAVIEKSGTRMLSIINDIINISKIEAGLMELNMQESNINEQIEYIYTFFKPEIKEKGMQVSFSNSLPSNEAIIKTDREKVYAILTNIVKNAIKFSEKGSIEFGYTKKNNFLEFYVKDTGIGIPKDRQKAIFERFIQADITDLRAFQGSGLGLSISKAYVEMLGGKIWVESEKGKGSIFYFTLPYYTETIKENKAKDESLPTVEASPINKLKILIVEDDETSEELLSIAVRKLGKEIINVKTGKEAVEACLDNPDIDLVLMDILMPEMDGHEATRQIRKFNKDVIIIAQTAYALEGDKEKAIAAGCNDYLSKPINVGTLSKLIANYF